jgi:CheY-like chemotaxis protein
MPKQILLVEDSLTMQKVVEITFAHEDYRVTAAKDADEALARLRELRPDVILADAGLPGKSGYDLAQAVKSDPGMREIPVLLLTGNFNPYDELRGQKAGVDAALVKPFETQVLLDKVVDLLRRKGAGVSAPATTLVSMPPISGVGGAGTGQDGGTRRPTVPPMPPPRLPMSGQMPGPLGGQMSGQMSGQAQPLSPGPVGIQSANASRPPVDPGLQRSTLMGIPAVNPLGPSGLRPPPPPGMRVRETGNLPAINPPNLPPPVQSGSPLPSWAQRTTETGRPSVAPSAAVTASPGANTLYGGTAPFSPPAAGEKTAQLQPAASPQGQAGAGHAVAGIPPNAPTMPRPSLIPRAPVPALVLAALERIAARGAEYEAVAKLSLETIEQIAWEVIPELAEAMIRSELDRLVKEREREQKPH